jgi:hypothetical protein
MVKTSSKGRLNLGRPLQKDDGWVHIAVYSKTGGAMHGMIKVNVRADLAEYMTAQEWLTEAGLV